MELLLTRRHPNSMTFDFYAQKSLLGGANDFVPVGTWLCDILDPCLLNASVYTAWKSIMNITSATVESDEKLPGVQGPVDWTEFAEVHDACNNHPAVLAEIEKLRLPPG